jgi:sulfur dioxygenase
MPNSSSSSALEIRQLFDRESCTYTYLLVCTKTRDAVLIDPVLDLTARDLEAVTGMKAKLKFVLNTHVHADHITSSGKLKAEVPGLQSVISKASGAMADVHVEHGDNVVFGEVSLGVRHTPGHTPGCVTYVLEASNEKEIGAAFTGDALLIRGCGRTDFQGGSAEALYDSVTREILSLPDRTMLWPAHGAGHIPRHAHTHT